MCHFNKNYSDILYLKYIKNFLFYEININF